VRATTIAPGSETQVDFDIPMGMHEGMEGKHLFRITVPVRGASGETGDIQLYVRADFR